MLSVTHFINDLILLRSESPSGMCAKLRTVVASNNRDHTPRSLYYCLFEPRIYGDVLRAHSVHGEPHIQRNANGEVTTTSPPFCNEPHRSHVLSAKVSHSTTFTSWSQHHFVAIRKPEQHVHKASHCGSKQQYRSCAAISLTIACLRYIYVWCCSSRTSRSW